MTQALERRVGGPLFERTSRRVVLTPLGRQLRDDLGPHYLGVLESVAKASNTARGIGEVLRVGFSSPLAGERVMTVVEAFRAARGARCGSARSTCPTGTARCAGASWTSR